MRGLQRPTGPVLATGVFLAVAVGVFITYGVGGVLVPAVAGLLVGCYLADRYVLVHLDEYVSAARRPHGLTPHSSARGAAGIAGDRSCTTPVTHGPEGGSNAVRSGAKN